MRIDDGIEMTFSMSHIPSSSRIPVWSKTIDLHKVVLLACATLTWLFLSAFLLSSALPQGAGTPYLHVSAMEEGEYTFQLTVTDSSGQQSSAEATVIVQPGR